MSQVSPVTPSAENRAALEALLQSGILLRSQNLLRLLVYICEKTFNGQADQLKEYTIATEALGRPANFDQKRDSIVRVEVHRLRKRLAQYYENVGKDDPVRIVIPEGKYVPLFVPRTAATSLSTAEGLPAEPVAAALAAIPTEGDPGLPKEAQPRPVPPPIEQTPAIAPAAEASAGLASQTWRLRLPRVQPLFWKWRIAAAVAVFLLLVGVGGVVWGSRTQKPAVPPVVPLAAEPAVTASGTNEVRIAVGRTKPFTDVLGRVWLEDRWFEGGWVDTSAHAPVSRTFDQGIVAARRDGEFSYHIPLDPGSYELRLYFAETVFGEGNPAGGGESSRFFRVEANGQPLLDSLDVIADAAGPLIADIKVFKNIEPAADGKLHLAFRSLMHSEPFVNAIEVRRTPPGRIRPIRLVAQPTTVRDIHGRVWEPDSFAVGGNLVKRVRPAENTDTPEIYRGERFGNFDYVIPVAADGVYKVSLHFHEAWFGPDSNGSGGEGSRLFDIFLNHTPVLPAFDVFRASGSRRALVKTIHGVKPNPRGKITLSFEPIRNYAFINAIEVEDESPIPARLRSAR